MGPSRLRFCSRRRCPYSSVRSSSLRAMRTLLSVPTAKRPPPAAKRGASKMPSPRLASVIGHRPATAPDFARRALSSGVMCVQWIRHQRASRPMLSSSHCTGRAPDQATQSSTSRACSAAWMWIGPSRHRCDERAQLAARRRRAANAARCRASRREAAHHDGGCDLDEPREAIEIEQEPRLPGRGRLSAAAAVGVERRKQRQADAARRAAATMRPAISAGLGVGRTVGRVVQVVELGDGGEPRLQHLDIELRRDRLDVIGRHLARSDTSSRARSRRCRPRGRAASARPAMARWKAWLCRLATPGRRRENARPLPAPYCPVSTAAIVPPSIVTETSDLHPRGVSALPA